MNVDVAIIGAGVSGLATAHRLVNQGLKVVVLERQAHAGGSAVSEQFQGFLMEHGPSTVATASLVARNYSDELGLEGQSCDLGPEVKYRYLVKGGKLSGIPVSPMGFMTSDYLSLTARLRLMAEAFIPRGGAALGAEETVTDFAARRFGREFAEQVMDPLIGGIYAGRAADLDVSAVFKRLVALEKTYGSITWGLFRKRREAAKMPGSRLFSWRDGIGTLPKTMARLHADIIHTGVAVHSIRPLPQGFVIDSGRHGSLTAGAVVLAVQPHVAAQLLEGVDAGAAEAIGGIAAPPVAVAYFGFRRSDVDHPLDSLGFLSAESENRQLNGVQFCSTMFPGRAPEGHVSVAAYMGGARFPDLAGRPGLELLDVARNELRDLIGARGEPVVTRIRHWPLGLPQYHMGHGKRIARLRETCDDTPGLFVTGNYFRGPSVAECLTLAQETAAEVVRRLADRQQDLGKEEQRHAVA